MATQFSRLYDVERVGGDQRTRLAELLRSQGMNQPQGQMVSGWYVPPSWSQNLNSALQMGLGTYMGSEIDKERKAETARLLRELGQGVEVPQEQKPVVFNNLERIETEGQTPAGQMSAPNQIQQLAGRMPASTEQSMMNPALALREPQPKFRPLTEEEKVARAMELAQINPAMAQVWSAQDTARQNRLTRGEEKAEAYRQQYERDLRDQQFRREMAGMTIANRPEQMISVMDAQGNPVLVPRSQAVGMTPFTPQSQKMFQSQKTASNDIQTALDAAAGLMTHEGKGAGTGWSAWTQNIPATKAKSFGADLNTYKAQGFLSAASALKGLGALSEKEGDRLIASIGALDPTQSEEDFNKGLTTSAKTIYNKAKAAGIDVKLPSVFSNEENSGFPSQSAIDAEIAARRNRR